MEHPPSRTSFVIATRDRAQNLAETLHRLLDTTDCPIILFDNASGDNNRDISAEISQRHPQGDRIRLIPLTSSEGTVARIGVAACRTPYVAFCDDDSWWQPDAMLIAEAEFDRHGELALFSGRTVVEPGGPTGVGARGACAGGNRRTELTRYSFHSRCGLGSRVSRTDGR